MDSMALSSQLRSVVSSLHKGLRKQSSEISSYSMTELETIANLVKNPSLLPTELASLTRVKTQSMSNILNKLEEQSVIKRTPSKEDKRKVYISLTATGKKMIEKAIYERDEWLKHVIENSLTEKERTLLEKCLPILNKLAETK